MTHSNEALSRLRGITLEDLTTEQMSSVLGPSSISPAVVSQFEQANLLRDAITAQRCYSYGLPIPEEGAVAVISIDPGSITFVQPSGTELWEIAAMQGFGVPGSADLQFSYTDGTSDVEWALVTVIAAGTKVDMNHLTPAQIRINNSLYFKIEETSGLNAATLFIAYHKRSM